MVIEGFYQVAGYQGNMYYRFVPYSSTTVYCDHHLATFATEQETLDYIDRNEEDYFQEYCDRYL